MIRYALALPRCAVLAVFTAAGFAYGVLLVAAATLVVPYPAVLLGQFRIATLGRRLTRAWTGADLPDVERTPPPEPRRRPDGWYVHDKSLFRSPRIVRWLIKGEHYGNDPEVAREWRWLMLAPFSSALPVLVPVALIVAAVLLRNPLPLAAALLLAPFALRLYGSWTRSLLRHRSTTGWFDRASVATWRAAGLVGLSLAAFAGTLLNLVVVALSLGGLAPQVIKITRPLVERYRSHADLPAPYRPYPPPPLPDEDGNYRIGRTLYPELRQAISVQRYGWLGGDPATWRDQLWSLGALLLAPLSLVPALLVSFGFYGLVWQPLTWIFWAVPVGVFTGYWVTPFWLWYAFDYAGWLPAQIPGWTSIPLGLLLALLGLLLAAPLMRLRKSWDRLLLGPTSATVLATRVAELSTSRADTVDVQAAELRRIERDLHDGAQARLIAVGLGLNAVAHLMETDPVRARQLLAQAQETSAAALTELRNLVRGIHPPVLAERGLGDAVRAIALDTPLPVTVDVDLPGRPEPPVESAVYFAACEALANAARVAAHVSITLSHRDGRLRMVVSDDGPGGADPARGTGLRGITRRLGTFDGTLTLDSPAGGPTVVTMEVPCALSSPRTSTC
ncbi:sensor histidine kinase [Actinoplanes sp. GCM10030250]|uniref:sensor histidine kinase n=1 Tax=Actinoplanes sp. GCM10030250 TaxID=3273376 RepID=UPI00361EAC4B